MSTTKEKVRELLIEAVLQSDGGPTSADGWEAENIADDILLTDAWGELMRTIDEHYREGFRKARATSVYADLQPIGDPK